MDKYDLPDAGLPVFNYWPPEKIGQVPSTRYSIVDGGNLEDNGAFFADNYTILPDNSLDIPPYPQENTAPYLGGGQVRVMWFYLNYNKEWLQAITDPQVHQILESSSFSNFPNYNTVFQNGIEVLLLNTAQIQLLAHMTAYNITDGASAEALAAFQEEVICRI